MQPCRNNAPVKVNVQHLTLHMPFMVRTTFSSDAIRVIAENTGSLRSIDIAFDGIIFRSDLEALAKSNMQIEKITLRRYIPRPEKTFAYIVDIIDAFSVCPLLKSVHFECLDKPLPKEKVSFVSNACLRFRHRRISVIVDQVRYL